VYARDDRGAAWRVYDEAGAAVGGVPHTVPRLVQPGSTARVARRLFVRERDGLVFGMAVGGSDPSDLSPATLRTQLLDALRGLPAVRAAFADGVARPGWVAARAPQPAGAVAARARGVVPECG
jgi:hypothetical protein